MKSIWVLGLTALLSGCQGSAGPSGPPGQAGEGFPPYSVEFEDGLYPDSGYNGCDSHWLDASSPNSAPTTGEIKLATGAATSDVALGLIRFNLSYAVPMDATITSASLQLAIQASTNLASGTYVFGVHQVIPPPAGQVPWNDASTWNVVVAPYGWNGGNNSPITAGVDYYNTPMDSVTVTSTQVNGNQVLLAWNIDPSLAQVWTNPSNNNYGLLISPEPETSSTLSGFISFWDNTGTNAQKPKMLVTYIIHEGTI